MRQLQVIAFPQEDSHLNLEQVVAADSLVVHLMIGIISIAAALVLYERKPRAIVSSYISA